MYLTADQILGKDARKFAEVDVPEWGGKVRIASMSGQDAFDYQELARKKKTGGSVEDQLLKKLIVGSVVDAEGRRVFKPEDADVLFERNPLDVLMRIGDAAVKLNGFDRKPEETEGN